MDSNPFICVVDSSGCFQRKFSLPSKNAELTLLSKNVQLDLLSKKHRLTSPSKKADLNVACPAKESKKGASFIY